MLGSGRDKIETKEQMEASKKVRMAWHVPTACLPHSKIFVFRKVSKTRSGTWQLIHTRNEGWCLPVVVLYE